MMKQNHEARRANPRTRRPLPPVCVLLLAGWLAGCTSSPPPGNGNGNGNDNTADPTIVAIPLGETGVFGAGISSALTGSGVFDISAAVPQETPDEIRLSLDPADIAIGTAFDADTTGAGSLTFLVNLSPADAADPCGVPSQQHFFDAVITSNAVASVTPTSSVVDSNGFELLRGGRFGLCFGAIATREVAVRVSALRVRYVLPGEIVVESCADVLGLPEVQAAIAHLDSNGITFALPDGSAVPDIEGIYALQQETTFDPDGDNLGDTQSGTVTLGNQTATTIRRSGFNAFIDQFVVGDATSVGFCTVQRTNAPTCDQTIARLERHALDAATGDLTGRFLAVVVRRHAFTASTCGPRRSFIHGTVSLASAQPRLIRTRGKVALPAGFRPDLLVLAHRGDNGTVTDADSGSARQFAAATPFGTKTISPPAGLGATGFSALGIARDDSRLAVVTDAPDAALVYNNATLALVRKNPVADAYDFLGGLVDFNLDATQLFVPSTSLQFADRITVLRADDSALPDEIFRFSTPQDKLPVLARLSPDGTQLAVLLEAGAPIGEAAELTFGDPERGAFLTPPLDLVADAGGTALADQLVYAANGSRVFLAGLGAVLAVDAQAPHAITRVDVSNGAGDSPVALALSGDGAVLAVAIDDAAGDADFAVVDAATLQVLSRQDLPGIGNRRALDVAHFATQRLAVVANLDSTVVGVRTIAPFTAGQPILVADVQDRTALGRLAAGDGVIAVTNVNEPAVYLLEPGEP